MDPQLKIDLRRSLSGELPMRNPGGRVHFYDLLAPSLVEDCRILDVGSGRMPVIRAGDRPAGSHYVGLDISRTELEQAPDGSYDSFVVGDVCKPIAGLEDRFDLVISWQLLEHVASLDKALENIRSYVRPGGRFLAQFSGAFSYFALAGHVIPHRVKQWMLHAANGRDPGTVFHAPYNHCWDSQIRRIMSDWSEATVTPRYAGGWYLKRVPPLLALCNLYEHWAIAHRHANLATHYVVDARR